MEYVIRRARTQDVRAIGALVEGNVGSGRLLAKATVTLYEDVQEFWIAERVADGEIVGCGALHVLWEDLAEIRTIAVRADLRGRVLRRARLQADRRVAGLTGGIRGVAPLLRRGRRRIPRPRPREAQHAGQY